MDYMPTDVSIVAANISKVRRVKESAVNESGGGKLNTLNVILDFDNIIAKKPDGKLIFKTILHRISCWSN